MGSIYHFRYCFFECVRERGLKKGPVEEAFYVALAEGTRELPGIFDMPQESAAGWSDIFDKLKDCGVQA